MAATPGGTENERLTQANRGEEAWRDWGPYVAERAWGSVREDYSADGDAWQSFPHDQARSRAYRWNEDGMGAFCDLEQTWCLGLALWNGVDPILKERMFGLSGPEGNHGEDVKEYWWYLDGTPTHSWNSWRYHYPQRAYPYEDLIETNARRSRADPEYELADTGIFDDGRYWVVGVDYAKAGPHDLLMRIEIENAGPDEATLDVLPTLWFRNTWSWGYDDGPKPELTAEDGTILGHSVRSGELRLSGDGQPETLFCENETNVRRLYGANDGPAYPKDGINDHVVTGADTVNPAATGTKGALHYSVTVPGGGSTVIRVRLTQTDPGTDPARPRRSSAASDPTPAPARTAAPASAAASTPSAAPASTPSAAPARVGEDFDTVIALRQSEADDFWSRLTPAGSSDDRAKVLRQSLSGLLWSKQFFHYNVQQWLDGDPGMPPPPPGRGKIRNGSWRHLNAHDVILMPDAWEYPWFAAWDLAFHCVTLAHIDPEFAKAQLVLMLREWYMHPSGQLAAYEWNFSDVNPPTHAWAALRVFELDGGRDFVFLARVFHKLLMNFTWWTNNKSDGSDNLYEGGFLGLDNIAPIDRSAIPPSVGTLEQADATAWMAMYALDLLAIALRLAARDTSYQDVAIKFVEHFLRIAASANSSGMWDEADAYFYDVLHTVDGQDIPLKVRSLVGLVPIVASIAYDDPRVERMPELRERVEWFLEHNPEMRDAVHTRNDGDNRTVQLALVSPERLQRVLTQVFDEKGLLSPHGIRGISAYHRDHPFTISVAGVEMSVDYEPGESTTALFGGNSNWRGPVWFPLNTLLIEALRSYGANSVDTVRVEFPLGSGSMLSTVEAADAIAERLIELFVPGPDGKRPSDARYPLLSSDPRWRDQLLFYEYFHGDTGQGLGASHQTGWSALVAHLILTLGSDGSSGSSLS